jgi:hypothetical protein
MTGEESDKKFRVRRIPSRQETKSISFLFWTHLLLLEQDSIRKWWTSSGDFDQRLVVSDTSYSAQDDGERALFSDSSCRSSWSKYNKTPIKSLFKKKRWQTEKGLQERFLSSKFNAFLDMKFLTRNLGEFCHRPFSSLFTLYFTLGHWGSKKEWDKRVRARTLKYDTSVFWIVCVSDFDIPCIHLRKSRLIVTLRLLRWEDNNEIIVDSTNSHLSEIMDTNVLSNSL